MGKHKRGGCSRLFAAFLAGTTAVIVLFGGSGAVWAFWTASATGAGALTTQSVAVTQTNFPALAATYYNSSLTSTGSFTVQNTGALSGTTSVSITSPGAFAALLPVRVWPVTTGNPCTTAAATPSTAGTGTWASVSLASSVTLAPTASLTYCVRTTITDRTTVASSAGAQSTSPVLTATLAADGWTAQTAAPLTAPVQATNAIYPLDSTAVPATGSQWFIIRSNTSSSSCLDVSASGAAGAAVSAYTCTNNANQWWQLIPVSESNPSLVTIRPRHGPSTRLTATGTNAQQLAAVSGATNQQWHIQRVSSTRYQLVSAATGLCLVTTATTVATQNASRCDTTGAILDLARQPLTFTSAYQQGTFTIGSIMTSGSLTVQYLAVGLLWTNLASTATNATSVTFLTTAPIFASTEGAQVRIILANGDVAYGGIVLKRDPTTNQTTALAGVG